MMALTKSNNSIALSVAPEGLGLASVNRAFFLCHVVVVILFSTMLVSGEESPASAPTDVLPHIDINIEKQFVDVDATVVQREADWIELLACTTGSREYESIIVVEAIPRHIHLALVMIGLKPGAPMKWSKKDDEIVMRPPRGPRVAVSFLVKRDEQVEEIAANQWIINQKTGKKLKDNVWLFTGSGFVEYEGEKIYRADVSGTVISVVNFGDDLLARPTKQTNHDDQSTWVINSQQLPPVKTGIKVRLRRIPPTVKKKAKQNDKKKDDR